MKRSASSGQYAGKEASSSDLERGFIADNTHIPNVGENIFNPASGKRKDAMAEYMMDDEPDFKIIRLTGWAND